MAEVKLTMDEWNDEIARRQAVENELAALRAQVANQRVDMMAAAAKVNVTRLESLVRDSMLILRFAVSNLPPETTKGWPLEALRRASENFDALPSFGIDDRDLQTELRAFVREVEDNENRRRRAPA